jgi:hypothetical protein
MNAPAKLQETVSDRNMMFENLTLLKERLADLEFALEDREYQRLVSADSGSSLGTSSPALYGLPVSCTLRTR